MRPQPPPAQVMPAVSPLDKNLYQDHAVFRRKLKRLRHAMDVAHDPADFFEATSDYISAIGTIGHNAMTSVFELDSAHVTLAYDAAQASGDQRSEGARPREDDLLALTLHAALSAHVLQFGQSPRALDPSACLGKAGMTGGGKPTHCRQASGSQHQHVSLLSNSSSTTAQPLQQSFSLPPDFMQGVGSPSTDASGGGTSAGGLLRSNSAVQTDVSSRDLSHLRHTARLSHTCTQAPNAQQAHQHLQPTVSDKDSLYSLLCQQLQATAKPCVKKLGGIKAHVPQYAASPQQQQRQQQGQQASADSDERKAVLIRRLKQAMTWSSAQRRRDTAVLSDTGNVYP